MLVEAPLSGGWFELMLSLYSKMFDPISASPLVESVMKPETILVCEKTRNGASMMKNTKTKRDVLFVFNLFLEVY